MWWDIPDAERNSVTTIPHSTNNVVNFLVLSKELET
jgi:hypothetical protein